MKKEILKVDKFITRRVLSERCNAAKSIFLTHSCPRLPFLTPGLKHEVMGYFNPNGQMCRLSNTTQAQAIACLGHS